MPLRLTLFGGLRPLSRGRAMRDALAGVTLASMNIPQVLGYTRIAETPVVTGLCTVLLPLVAFATFGSSRHLVVAAVLATAAIFASGLLGMAPPASARYMALVGMVALLTAGLLLLARVFKLGFLADFLSRTVLVGFLSGVGFQVGIAMLGDMLGVAINSQRTVGQLWQVIQSLGTGSPPYAGNLGGGGGRHPGLSPLPAAAPVSAVCEGRCHHRELCMGLCRPRHRRRRAGSGRAAHVRSPERELARAAEAVAHRRFVLCDDHRPECGSLPVSSPRVITNASMRTLTSWGCRRRMQRRR